MTKNEERNKYDLRAHGHGTVKLAGKRSDLH